MSHDAIVNVLLTFAALQTLIIAFLVALVAVLILYPNDREAAVALLKRLIRWRKSYERG